MSKLNKRLELIANFSVIVGIVFLATEIRQNTRAIQAQTRDSVTEKQMLFSEWIATTPELAEAWHLATSVGMDSVDTYRRPMLIFYVHGVFRAWENEWYQFQQGLFLEEEFMPRRERWRINLTYDAWIRDSWLDTRETFSPSFRA